MLKYAVSRLTFWIWRFRTLSRAARLFASAPSPCILTRELFGHQIRLDVSRGSVQQLLYLEGERAIEERRLVSSLLRPGMRAVDVGANIGYYLLMLEQGVGPTGEVICIEPSPDNLPELRETIAANGFANVEVLEVAIGRENRRTGLKAGINSGVTEAEEGVYEVELRTLDSVTEGTIDFIKIDVEGYEFQVLEGARGVLDRCHPTIFLEVHPALMGQFGDSVSDLASLLHDHYDDVVYYETPLPQSQGIVDKIAARYLSRDPFAQIAAPAQAIADCESGVRTERMWVVCR